MLARTDTRRLTSQAAEVGPPPPRPIDTCQLREIWASWEAERPELRKRLRPRAREVRHGQ